MSRPVLISNGDASAAFYDQFSTIIRLESRLHWDNSEDITGPAHQRWAVRHLAEVAQAQGLTSRLPAEETNLNVQARHFVTPPPAQTATNNLSGHVTPWYQNFNLADQGVLHSSGPYRPPTLNSPTQYISQPPNTCAPFTPAELAAFHAAVQTPPVFLNSTQRVPSVFAEHDNHNYNSDPFVLPYNNRSPSQIPSTPPSRIQHSSPSTPSNQPITPHGQTSSAESPPDLFGNRALRANTEPIAQSTRMSSFTAPDHYKPFEIYALEIEVGDYIQGVQKPGKVLSHYPVDLPGPGSPLTNTTDPPPVNPDGTLRIQYKGADGTIRTKVFKGLDMVQVLREDVTDDDESKGTKEEEEGRKEEGEEGGAGGVSGGVEDG